jgi:hypothetical protein
MAISINSRVSGFRKWSEALELKRIDEARGRAGQDSDVATPNIDDVVITTERAPHRPWLVPGAGKL